MMGFYLGGLEMNLALFVYIAGIIDSVLLLLHVFFTAIITTIFFVFTFHEFFEAKNDVGYPILDRKENSYFNENILPKRLKAKRFILKYSAPTLIILAVVIILLPNERTLYMIAGAYATEQIAKNERVNKIGSDVLDIIENKLEDLKK